MLNKFLLTFAFSIIVLSHYTFLNYTKIEKVRQIVASKPTVIAIALNKVSIKQKEIKKIEPKVIQQEPIIKVEPKKIIPKPKKIVKKAKIKIEKKVKKKTVKKKIIKKPIKKIIEKIVKKTVEKPKKIKKKIVQKEQPKLIQTVTKKIIPIKTKKAVVSDVTKNILKNEYLTRIKSHIEKYKKYPKRAKRLKQQGNVIVRFEIKKNGQIHSVNIKSKCPYKRLNTAALNLLKEIAKFDPIPDELNKNSWAIEVPISYSIINS